MNELDQEQALLVMKIEIGTLQAKVDILRDAIENTTRVFERNNEILANILDMIEDLRKRDEYVSAR